MESINVVQLKKTCSDTIRNFRVSDLQALLDFARLPRQGYKKDLYSRCQLLILEKWSIQLHEKVKEIEKARSSSSRTSILNRNSLVSSSNNSAPSPYIDRIHSTAKLVQFAPIPFFNVIRTIEQLNISVERRSFSTVYFVLNDNELDSIRKGLYKVVVRLAVNNTNVRQLDVLPPYIYVQCNGRAVINNNGFRPAGTPAHSIAFPFDITDRVAINNSSLNKLEYYWLQLPIMCGFRNLPDLYTISIQVIQCVSIDHLISEIIKRPALNDDSSKNVKISMNENDFGLETTQQSVSLICPISQKLIVNPTKSLACSHLSCFDLRAFLQMNQRRTEWFCPLCKKSTPYESLVVDPLLNSILENLPMDCSTVQIDNQSHEFTYVVDEEKIDSDCSPNKNKTQTIIVLSDDDDDENSPVKQSSCVSSNLNSNGKRSLPSKSSNTVQHQRKRIKSSPFQQNYSNQNGIIELSSTDNSDSDYNESNH